MNILLLETIHQDAIRLLEEAGEVHQLETADPAIVLREFANAEAVITRGRGRMPREALLAGKRLKCVARCGAGTDNIDVTTATALGLPVLYSPASTTVAVAEHAIMLMLAASRRLAFLDREVRSGNWEIRNRTGLNIELCGKTLGILGMGRIGRRIAELGEAFGMRIIYWSRSSRDEHYRFVEIGDLFTEADFLSISLSLNDDTRCFVDEKLITLLKPTAILINTARGELIDENAVYQALKNNRIAGAGFDVLAIEPPPADHPLLSLTNVVFTPHVAIWTDVTYRNMCIEVAAQVVNVLLGREIDVRNVRNTGVLESKK